MPGNHFDKAARYAAKLDPPGFLGWLLGLPPGELGFVGFNAIERFCQLQVFLDRGDFVVQTTTFLLELLQPVLVGADSLFKTNQYIGEFFHELAPR